MSATNFLELKLLDHLVNNAAYTAPNPMFIALATAVSDAEAGSFTEVLATVGGSGTGYTRMAAANSSWASASSGSVTTSADIQFPVATAAYGSAVTHIALMDASSGGDCLLIQALTASKTVDTDDQFVINSGNLTISLD